MFHFNWKPHRVSQSKLVPQLTTVRAAFCGREKGPLYGWFSGYILLTFKKQSCSPGTHPESGQSVKAIVLTHSWKPQLLLSSGPATNVFVSGTAWPISKTKKKINAHIEAGVIFCWPSSFHYSNEISLRDVAPWTAMARVSFRSVEYWHNATCLNDWMP